MTDNMLPEDVPLEKIHTLQSDMAEVVNKQNVSQAAIIVQKEKQKEVQINPSYEASSSTSPHLIRNLLITILAIVIIAGSGYGILKLAKQRSQEAPVLPASPSENLTLFTYNSTKSLTFSTTELNDREALVQKLHNEAVAVADGITFYQTSPDFKDLLFIISPSLPPEHYRSLKNEDFFGGIKTGNFFVLETESYEQAYAGQLAWEPAMGNDLQSVFHTSTGTFSKFEDRILVNKDIRVAVDTFGKTLFLYGFHDSKTLIFAENEEVFRTVHEMLLRKNL
jgi:hypothetical protein